MVIFVADDRNEEPFWKLGPGKFLAWQCEEGGQIEFEATLVCPPEIDLTQNGGDRLPLLIYLAGLGALDGGGGLVSELKPKLLEPLSPVPFVIASPKRSKDKWWTISDSGGWGWLEGEFLPREVKRLASWVKYLMKQPMINASMVSILGFSAGAYAATELLGSGYVSFFGFAVGGVHGHSQPDMQDIQGKKRAGRAGHYLAKWESYIQRVSDHNGVPGGIFFAHHPDDASCPFRYAQKIWTAIGERQIALGYPAVQVDRVELDRSRKVDTKGSHNYLHSSLMRPQVLQRLLVSEAPALPKQCKSEGSIQPVQAKKRPRKQTIRAALLDEHHAGNSASSSCNGESVVSDSARSRSPRGSREAIDQRTNKIQPPSHQASRHDARGSVGKAVHAFKTETGSTSASSDARGSAEKVVCASQKEKGSIAAVLNSGTGSTAASSVARGSVGSILAVRTFQTETGSTAASSDSRGSVGKILCAPKTQTSSTAAVGPFETETGGTAGSSDTRGSVRKILCAPKTQIGRKTAVGPYETPAGSSAASSDTRGSMGKILCAPKTQTGRTGAVGPYEIETGSTAASSKKEPIILPASQATIRCNSCGDTCPPDRKFCPSCGERFEASEARVKPARAAPAEDAELADEEAGRFTIKPVQSRDAASKETRNKGMCHFFVKNGWCGHGFNCIFSHVSQAEVQSLAIRGRDVSNAMEVPETPACVAGEAATNSGAVERILSRTGTISGAVEKIVSRTGWYIDQVELHLCSGEVHQYGKSGGIDCQDTKLREGEYIRAVGQRNWHVGYLGSALVFHLSTGREVTIEGTSGKKKWTNVSRLDAPAGEQVYGLEFDGSRLTRLLTSAVVALASSRRRS